MTFASCTDDNDDLWDAIDDLENRVTILEELCSQMNTNLSSLQSIVDVLENGDYITNIAPITQGDEEIGYTISFGKHSPVTIYHGHSPALGVRAYNGVYYWTLDGDWLLANGQRLKVEGEKGEDGITPQLEIKNGYWYLSTDNGSSWQQLGKATGEDGDSMFESVTQDEDYAHFVLTDGTSFTIPKNKGITIGLSQRNNIPIYSGQSDTLTYELWGAGTTPVMEIKASKGWTARIAQNTTLTGNIIVTCPDTATVSANIEIHVSDEKGQTGTAELTYVPEIYIPDENFKAYLLQKVDIDGDGVLSQSDINAWNNGTQKKSLSPRSLGIKTLEGIQHFTALEELDCYNNSLTELNISDFPSLNLLWCSGNQLKNLSVNNCPALTNLGCSENQLTQLNISGCSALKILNCSENQFETLDLRKLTNLEEVDCSNNQLVLLEVNGLFALTELTCSYNQLRNLDLTECPALTYVYAGNNQLPNLNVPNDCRIEWLEINDNQFLTLDINWTAIGLLTCSNNPLIRLELDGCVNLVALRCSNTQLTELNVSDCVQLTDFVVANCKLTNLDLSNNPKLHYFYCQGNQLTTLDVSKTDLGSEFTSKWEEFNCYMPSLETLILKSGWMIKGITYNRDPERIFEATRIIYQ